MGGGVDYNVLAVAPGLVDAAAVFAPVSPRPYFDRIAEPLLIHHGTADASCPIRWSRASYRALRAARVGVEMFTSPGEPHAFVDAWPLSMRRTVSFFQRHLG